MESNTPVGILGAGISGLSIAWALKKKGITATLYEKKDTAGGVIQTRRDNGWLVEEGPNTMLVRNQKIWDLLDELQLADQIIKPGAAAKKRYIIRDKKLCAAPMSLMDFLKTDLISTSAKFRLLKEPFISAPLNDDESIAGFIRRRLGSEPLNYAVNPFVSGIYAGDPKKLSIKHTFGSIFKMEKRHGSITKGFLKREKHNSKAERALISFEDGLQTLPKAFHKKLGDTVQLNAPISKISRTATDWNLELQTGEKVNHRAIVSTVPAYQLQDIWSVPKSTQSIRQLADIDYAPMSVLGLGFKRDQVNHSLNGFGMLIPEVEPFSLLGCLFSSSLFPNRAPQGHVLLTCFMGGARHRALAGQSMSTLISESLAQLDKLLGVEGQPVFSHHTYWPKAIPQYSVGYDTYLQCMDQMEKTNPGFYLAGNYRGGVSVPDCIINGFETAERIVEYLESEKNLS